MPSKIIPIVAYVVSIAVHICSCTEVTPVERNDGGRLQDAVYANTGRCVRGGMGGGGIFYQSVFYQ